MKALIAILMTVSVIANTYVLTDSVSAKTDGSYQPLTEITVENLTLNNADIYERKAYISAVINGEKRELVAKINDRLYTGSKVNYLLGGELDGKVLSRGACDEYEAFSYRYKMVISEDKETRAQELKLTKLSLYHSYSWDQCHDRTLVLEFPYSQK
ncbi:hypothetical protein [Halobacteriovorax sp. YZS-1-1]|uniref:hypothetical protein n=1 Tax=unclassified Halobacteriovorax TaxID=2639665 RepID=UPI00399B26F6